MSLKVPMIDVYEAGTQNRRSWQLPRDPFGFPISMLNEVCNITKFDPPSPNPVTLCTPLFKNHS
jgi:hypothetical protein